MKTIISFALFVLLFPATASAGEIYGTIKEGTRLVGQGIKIEIASGGSIYSTETDKYGSYRLFVKERGKCQLRVLYGQQSPSIEIASYDRSVRYDLALEKKDGNYALRRE